MSSAQALAWWAVAGVVALLVGVGLWLWWRLRLWWAAVEARNVEWLQQIHASDYEIGRLEQARRMPAREQKSS